MEDFDYHEVDYGEPNGVVEYGGNAASHRIRPEGRLRTGGRAFAFALTALALALVTGGAFWLLGARGADQSANRSSVGTAANSYSISRPGADITGLGTGPRVGALAPDFGLKDLYTGEVIRLSAFRGRPVWINFWASWCPSCKAEMPDMKQVYARYREQGLVLLGVDLGEDPAAVKEFTTSNGYNWTFAIDSDSQVTNKYYVFSIPTHLFVGKDGVIREMQIGPMSANIMEERLSSIINGR